MMRSKDHYGNDQLSGQQVSASLRAVGLTVERSAFASWLRSADTIGKGIYSIPGLLEVMSQAVKRAKGEEGRPTRDKRIPEVHERRDKALVAAPLTNANTKEEDLSWQQLLDLNSSLPRVRGRGEDGGLRLRNLARLRTAMEQSYKQQHGEQIRSKLNQRETVCNDIELFIQFVGNAMVSFYILALPTFQRYAAV